MRDVNDHGLPRYIKESVKAEVRARCGFGCVICGSIPYQYDHCRVQWVDAKVHDPEDIVLLCSTHHTMKTAGTIDHEWIARALRVRSVDRPAHFKLPGTSPDFRVNWPAVEIHAARQSIVIDGQEVLHLDYLEDELEPVRLSGIFRGRSGDLLCQIQNNELSAQPGHFGDFFCTANRFEFRDHRRRRALSFSLDTSGLTIKEIAHVSGGSMVLGNRNGLWVCNGVRTVGFKDVRILECQVAVAVNSRWPADYEQRDIASDPNQSSLQSFTIQGGYGGVAL